MSPNSRGTLDFGNTWEIVSNEIAPSTTIYADLDVIGTLLTFPDVIQSDIGGGEIVDAAIIDTSSVSAPLELLLFSSAPTTTTITATGDNAILVLADTDAPKVCASITFSTGGNQVILADNVLHFADTRPAQEFLFEWWTQPVWITVIKRNSYVQLWSNHGCKTRSQTGFKISYRE